MSISGRGVRSEEIRKGKKMSVIWTERQEKLIRKFFPMPDGAKKIREITGFTYTQIITKARHLGLSQKKTCMIRHRNRFRLPAPPRWELLSARICPGNGNGPCGQYLYMERVITSAGFTDQDGAFDLACISGHRFLFPGINKKTMKIPPIHPGMADSV